VGMTQVDQWKVAVENVHMETRYILEGGAGIADNGVRDAAIRQHLLAGAILFLLNDRFSGAKITPRLDIAKCRDCVGLGGKDHRGGYGVCARCGRNGLTNE
jgi:hypothetical protein